MANTYTKALFCVHGKPIGEPCSLCSPQPGVPLGLKITDSEVYPGMRSVRLDCESSITNAAFPERLMRTGLDPYSIYATKPSMGLREALTQAGYVDGQKVVLIDARMYEEMRDRLGTLTRILNDRKTEPEID